MMKKHSRRRVLATPLIALLAPSSDVTQAMVGQVSSTLTPVADETESRSFGFGLNEPFNKDEVFQQIIEDSPRYADFASLFAEFHIDHIRYPGGTASRFYFWDDDGTLDDQGLNLSTAAMRIMGTYYDDSGKRNRPAYDRGIATYAIGNYRQYLQFCKATGIKPIITLNDIFYHVGSTIYPVVLLEGGEDGYDLGLQSDRWSAITRSLEAQLDFTHQILNYPITWEIGNEDFFIVPAIEYGEVVERFSSVIKSRYPDDQIIASYSKGSFSNTPGHSSPATRQWNQDFVDYLVQKSVISRIAAFQFHYYYAAGLACATQEDLDARVNHNPFTQGMIEEISELFPPDYSPQYSITEFSPILQTSQPEYNTQMHALLMFDELMTFHSVPNILSATRHTGFDISSGSFFLANEIPGSPLEAYVDSDRQDSILFAYIPPETIAQKMFYDTTGDTLVGSSLMDGYRLLVTQTNGTIYLQVLNFASIPHTIDISSYGSGTYISTRLPDLTDHAWDLPENQLSGRASTSLEAPPHSFTALLFDVL